MILARVKARTYLRQGRGAPKRGLAMRMPAGPKRGTGREQEQQGRLLQCNTGSWRDEKG